LPSPCAGLNVSVQASRKGIDVPLVRWPPLIQDGSVPVRPPRDATFSGAPADGRALVLVRCACPWR